MSVRCAVGAVAILLLATQTAKTQWLDRMFNPKLRGPVSHAPGLGLQINRVAFGASSGEGSSEFIDALTTRLFPQTSRFSSASGSKPC